MLPAYAEGLPDDFSDEEDDSPEDESETSPTAEGDGHARRAWRAAVIGLFVFPPMLHFYSAWTLLRLSAAEHPLSSVGRRDFALATIVDLAVAALVGVLIYSVVQ